MADGRVSLDQLNQKYLDCHIYGHTWRVQRGQQITYGRNNKPVETTEILHCGRCTMKRKDTYMLPWWELKSRRYEEPDGYYLTRPEDGSRHTRRDARAERFKRMVGE